MGFHQSERARLVRTIDARLDVRKTAEPKAIRERVLATSEEAIRERTGRGWEEWFDLLDEWGAPGHSHREIARWVAEQQGIAPLAWNAQAVTSSYERAARPTRRRRASRGLHPHRPEDGRRPARAPLRRVPR
jgi:hypothetical protein